MIGEALADEGASAESVAAAIAASEPFLKAITIGMEHGAEQPSVREKIVLAKLRKAFIAANANQMFDE